MQKEKAKIAKRQKESRQLLQPLPAPMNARQDDLLWHQTPEMGAEALIATIDCKRKIKKELRKMVKKRSTQRKAYPKCIV